MPTSRVVRLAALALVAFLALAGCRSLTGRSMSRYVDDAAITAKVKMKLTGRRASMLTRINVDTYEGIVYLTGIVDSADIKAQAGTLAERVDGVEQVVNDLFVRRGNGTGLASPRGDRESPAPAAVTGTSFPPHPLLTRVPGILRLEAVSSVKAPATAAAYDARGRRVATVYTVSMLELAQHGFEHLDGAGLPVDHVSIYPSPSYADMPDAHYHVVLWHVSRSEVSALLKR